MNAATTGSATAATVGTSSNNNNNNNDPTTVDTNRYETLSSSSSSLLQLQLQQQQQLLRVKVVTTSSTTAAAGGGSVHNSSSNGSTDHSIDNYHNNSPSPLQPPSPPSPLQPPLMVTTMMIWKELIQWTRSIHNNNYNDTTTTPFWNSTNASSSISNTNNRLPMIRSSLQQPQSLQPSQSLSSLVPIHTSMIHASLRMIYMNHHQYQYYNHHHHNYHHQNEDGLSTIQTTNKNPTNIENTTNATNDHDDHDHSKTTTTTSSILLTIDEATTTTTTTTSTTTMMMMTTANITHSSTGITNNNTISSDVVVPQQPVEASSSSQQQQQQQQQQPSQQYRIPYIWKLLLSFPETNHHSNITTTTTSTCTTTATTTTTNDNNNNNDDDDNDRPQSLPNIDNDNEDQEMIMKQQWSRLLSCLMMLGSSLLPKQIRNQSVSSSLHIPMTTSNSNTGSTNKNKNHFNDTINTQHTPTPLMTPQLVLLLIQYGIALLPTRCSTVLVSSSLSFKLNNETSNHDPNHDDDDDDTVSNNYNNRHQKKNSHFLNQLMAFRLLILPLVLPQQQQQQQYHHHQPSSSSSQTPLDEPNDINDNDDEYDNYDNDATKEIDTNTTTTLFQHSSTHEELYDAILDAIFVFAIEEEKEYDDDNDNNNSKDEQQQQQQRTMVHLWIQSCLDYILDPYKTTSNTSTTKTCRNDTKSFVLSLSWKWSCRILRRFIQFLLRIHSIQTLTRTNHTTSSIRILEMIIPAMTTMIQYSIGMVVRDNNNNHHNTINGGSPVVSAILLPLVTDLLPLYSELITTNTTATTTTTTTIRIPTVTTPVGLDEHRQVDSSNSSNNTTTKMDESAIQIKEIVQTCVADLWTFMMEQYSFSITTTCSITENDSDDRQLLLRTIPPTTPLIIVEDDSFHSYYITPMISVITSILCSLLPSVVSLLAVPDHHRHRHRQHAPIIQLVYHHYYSPIWTLIQQCLRFGLLHHVDHCGRRQRRRTITILAHDSSKIDTATGTGTGGGGTTGRSSMNTNNNLETIRLHQLHRRRGIYLLSVLVEHYYDRSIQMKKGVTTTTTTADTDDHHQNIVLWRKYVSCFEIIEMESEQHLIDQIWETVTELFDESHRISTTIVTTSEQQQQNMTIPVLTWDWMKLLLGRILVSSDLPILRKLSLYRLFKGQAGIRIVNVDTGSADGGREESLLIIPITKSSKKKKNEIPGKPRGAPLTIITVDFLFTVIISSFDTLISSVGTNMQATAAFLSGSTSNGYGTNNVTNTSNVAVSEDMIPLLCTFVGNYLHNLLCVSETHDENDVQIANQLEEFFRRLWSADVVDGVHHKITVCIFHAIAETLRMNHGTNRRKIPIRDDMLRTIPQSFQLAFSDGSMVSVYKDSLLKSLAVILEHSDSKGFQNPMAILDVLALYPLPMLQFQLNDDDDEVPTTASAEDSVSMSLSEWLKEGVTFPSQTGINVGAAVATAFVDGMLQSPSYKSETSDWNPKSGCSDREHNLAKALVLFCILSNCDGTQTTAAEALWPAIHKGLSYASVAIEGNNWLKADRISRALLILYFGVYFRVLSGVGNGDLVVDKKTQNILPPPQSIDIMLGAGATFIFHHVKSLVSVKSTRKLGEYDISSQATRSSDARVLSVTFAKLAEQLQSFAHGFPSSLSIADVIGDVLHTATAAVMDEKGQSGRSNRALDIALIYMGLTCKGKIQNQNDALAVAAIILRSQFEETGEMGGNVQAVRSIFQFSKWGSLSCIMLQMLREIRLDTELSDINPFLDELFETAATSVESTPATALVPLFNCVVTAAEVRFANTKTEHGIYDYQQFDRVIQSLFNLIDACDCNSDSIGMIDQLCALIFQTTLMNKEYARFQEDNCCDTPIVEAFRRIVKVSGTEKPHISRIVISRICASWLKAEEKGLTAIPYRDDIVALLVQKEDLVPITSLFTYEVKSTSVAEIDLVANTNETNISRGFLLVFFSKLPDYDNNASSAVQTDLIEYVIVKLMHLVTRPPQTGSGLIMYGTPEYCVKIRALQGLCILSRFVTVDIADEVCVGLFEVMGKQTSHNQIRYFLEVFALRFARMHAAIFSLALVEQIRRTDLSLQMIASLMIISGNLIVGRYKDEFFQQYENGKNGTDADSLGRINLHSILAGVVPWLSSTQGFSRAIAQLLAHKLIPLVIDVDTQPPLEIEDSQWYLRSLYRFLDNNPEMTRLRKKQEHFFDGYEVDSVCTPEGLFAISVDEGQEANPVHMIEIIKVCLQEVYDDANIDRAPLWRQIEVATTAVSSNDINQEKASNVDEVNFQRKIIPIDELNLAMDDIRDQKHRNKMGRIKQNLIVCATLIDKIPNLGGLARTCEIFAASKLIVPDLQIVKMDNFKNLSVGAGDWIDIEECKEQNLLSWLRQCRDDGYHIVGLEQTSSSQSLLDYTFPNNKASSSSGVQSSSTSSSAGGGTVLLLGKEKEGIPIQYLQMVDQCLEIPQYGIIRSLNVHVSGAIAIWEYTKQHQQQQHQQQQQQQQVAPNYR